MDENGINEIFEQIDRLKKPNSDFEMNSVNTTNNVLANVLNGVSGEIQRVLDENNFTQEDLCRITGMSQSNVSKILNGKVAPRLDTLQKIAESTHTKLVISFEKMEEYEL